MVLNKKMPFLWSLTLRMNDWEESMVLVIEESLYKIIKYSLPLPCHPLLFCVFLEEGKSVLIFPFYAMVTLSLCLIQQRKRDGWATHQKKKWWLHWVHMMYDKLHIFKVGNFMGFDIGIPMKLLPHSGSWICYSQKFLYVSLSTILPPSTHPQATIDLFSVTTY